MNAEELKMLLEAVAGLSGDAKDVVWLFIVARVWASLMPLLITVTVITGVVKIAGKIISAVCFYADLSAVAGGDLSYSHNRDTLLDIVRLGRKAQKAHWTPEASS